MSHIRQQFGPFQAQRGFFPSGFYLLFTRSAAIDFDNIEGEDRERKRDYILRRLSRRANAGRFSFRKGFFPEGRSVDTDPFIVHVSSTVLHHVVCRSRFPIEYKTDEDY
jgi:hypothetical protein